MDALKYLPQILFSILFLAGIGFFGRNMLKIIRNIRLGKSLDRNDHKGERLKTMVLVALGQSKMVTRPLAAVMHIFVYVGFIIINMEMLEIVIDGVFGTHRVFAFMGGFYSFLIATFEVLAFLVIVGCAVFLVRRNSGAVKRLVSTGDLKAGPRVTVI